VRFSTLLLVVMTVWMAGGLQAQEREVIDVSALRSRASNPVDGTWEEYHKADKSGDQEKANLKLTDIDRQRIERNIPRLRVLALALVAEGLEKQRAGETDLAQSRYQSAIRLDPHLPDAHFALALTKLRQGPLKLPSAVGSYMRGIGAPWRSVPDRELLFTLLVPWGSVTLLAMAAAFSVALLLRYGVLLRHDVEELLGPERSALAIGLYTCLLLLPALAFLGYAWLPFWWFALLYIYARPLERALAVAFVLLLLLVGPLDLWSRTHFASAGNPLFQAALRTIDDGPDPGAAAVLERTRTANPDDRDLTYLTAMQYKRSGRYDDAAALYRELLASDPNDVLAINNLANLDYVEFTQERLEAAIARYLSAAKVATENQAKATVYYNLSLAYRQRFLYPQGDEARAEAVRLDPRLVAAYESQWSQRREGINRTAVVDLGLSREQVVAKFSGLSEGVGQKNVYRQDVVQPPTFAALLPGFGNRFSAIALFFVVFNVVRSKWRGSKAFTMRCLKCGVPFCRQCHLGAAIGGLCSQCHHLFVVRDGVSGPARNQKLLEVQTEDARRERVFRLLSLISPGTGHIYGRKTLFGLVLVGTWYSIIGLTLETGLILPMTGAPARLVGPWGLVTAVLVLLVIYVVANRARPAFEAALTVRRGPRRARV
jgi:tetratricopeptide (TPR) repeat protein